jgi:mono/diheme cytochrome c family protein
MRFLNTLITRTLLSVALPAMTLAGCRPVAAPQFTPSAAVTALDDEAADDEERQLYRGLQDQISKELLQRAGTPLSPLVIGDANADRSQLWRGADVYATRCQQCHGVNGDGLGAQALFLNPRPRDYTKGIFKFTSTPYGAKPRRSDLIQTLRRGVTGTSMPSFADLAPEDLDAVVDYVIFLSQRGELENELVLLAQDEGEINPEYVDESVTGIVDRWREAQSQLVMPLTPMPAFTAESIAKGHELFLTQACNKCHGVNGRGGALGNIEIGKDSWGHMSPAADLTSGMFRGGGRPIDIYRRIHSGINGTAMPAFDQVFAQEPDNIWHLVHFIRDTGERRRRNLPPVDESTATPAPATPTPAEAPLGSPAEPATQSTAHTRPISAKS